MRPEEFSNAISRTRLKERTTLAARRVLVDGINMSESARESGLTPQAVRQAVRTVENAHKNIIGCPIGWECVTVCVPTCDSYFAIKDLEDKELRKAGFRT